MIRYNKLKAFTLAEIMILLLTLSILLAAFAPVFTRRYANAGSDDVWSYVVADEEFDAYYDVPSDNYTAQAFIGLTPKDKFQVQKYSSDDSNNILYSKLVIASSKALSRGRGLQRQMQFRYGTNAGQNAGYLFAANRNILVGGNYSNIGTNVMGNTSFGYLSLDNKGNSAGGSGNTAIGTGALEHLQHTGYNTAIGANAGRLGELGYNNTLIGYNAGLNANNRNFLSNTAVGVSSMAGFSGNSFGNTAFGNYTIGGSGSGNSNVAVGYAALQKFGTGTGNTALGAYALSELKNGNYNTAIGYNACLQVKDGSYITCLGADSGSDSPHSGEDKIYSGNLSNDEVVLIGSKPIDGSATFLKDAAAVLEVHNRKTINSESAPMPGVGDESVVVNGNLIVRGATYLEVPIVRPVNMNGDNALKTAPKGLVAFRLNSNDNGNSLQAFSGYDGARRNGKTASWCDRRCKMHAFETVRQNAICTIVREGGPTSTNMASGSGTVSKSYDWFTKSNRNNTVDDHSCNNDRGNIATYKDLSYGSTIKLEQYQSDSGSADNTKAPGVDKPLAHLVGKESPCPNLSSDRRLKNVGDKFSAGLNEIRKLNIYNYTFKNDSNKLPQVGVIAQELKLVFPNAVSKGEDGYYKIRWDEMFYAAINSIKTLNEKIEKLASKIATDKNRIAILKKDNAELNAKLDKLAGELTQLEAKKHK